MPGTDSIRRQEPAPTPGAGGILGLCVLLALPGCRQPAPDRSAARRDIVATEKVRYSQHHEEVIIRDFFQDRRDGFFLDVGCAWPKKHSNTYYLESELGWSGIGVDALPEYARRWKRQRPRAKFFNYLVGDRSGTVETFFRAPHLPGISSVRPRESFSGKKVDYEEVKIPTITLTKLLEDNGVDRIDLLSMDIEGAEMPALDGFDIDRFRPELVCVEVYHVGREKVLGYFAAHGYEHLERYRQYDGLNYYFTPKPAP